MLADFNISFNNAKEETTHEETFGGTLAFMSPEHLEAFDPTSDVTPADVDERSDLWKAGSEIDCRGFEDLRFGAREVVLR